ncbi:MAG: hypothetical protein CMB37_01655 [Euryarchaeota archaeon]|nr:hypothetical protein [Euryarchaeota archaeon]
MGHHTSCDSGDWAIGHGEHHSSSKAALFRFRARNLDTIGLLWRYMTTAVRVATVIPTWQEVAHIERCLTSLIEQTYASENHQIIVVDGGSTDGTVEVIEKMIQISLDCDGPEIHLLNNPSRFVPHARNIAQEYLDQDVDFILEMIGHAWVPKNHLEIRIERFFSIESEHNIRLGGLGAKVVKSDLKMKSVGHWIESALSCKLGGSGQFARFSKESPTRTPPFTLYRREAIDSVGGWNENFITTQDSELNLRLIRNGWPLWRTPETYIHMAKRTSVKQWLRMGYRYGFWRMKHVIDARTRMRFTELLPWFGLSLVAGLAIDGQSAYLIPNFAWPIVAYFLTLLGIGLDEARRGRDLSAIIGVPFMLFLLHSSFSVGLLGGIFGNAKPSRDRFD